MKKITTNSFAILAFVATFIFATFSANANQTRENVVKRGSLNCGVSQGVPGFSNADASGKWTGIDVDVCRAIAAAVLGDATKVKYTPLSAKDRFEVLKAGDIDVLARNTTWTLSRDGGLALEFPATNFYDGQGFMIRKAANINSAKKLNNVKVCVETGTTTELNLRDYFKANKLKYEPVAFTKADEAVAAYDAGRCDVYTTDLQFFNNSPNIVVKIILPPVNTDQFINKFELPFISAPMDSVVSPETAIAIGEAGGLGVLNLLQSH